MLTEHTVTAENLTADALATLIDEHTVLRVDVNDEASILVNAAEPTMTMVHSSDAWHPGHSRTTWHNSTTAAATAALCEAARLTGCC